MSLDEKVKIDPLNYRLFKKLYEAKKSVQRKIHTATLAEKKYYRVLVSKYEKILYELFKKEGIYNDYFKKYTEETDSIG